MVKAGFNPYKAIEALEFLLRADFNIDDNTSSHPLTNNRLYNIKSLIKRTNLNELKKQGELNIKNSKPLIYEKSLDKKSLRINSKFVYTDSPADQFKQMFGK